MALRTRVGEIDIEWEQHGDGPPTLLLVHGFTGARSDFESHFEALARDRRVVAADHRGHGGSTNTGDEATYTLEALTADLVGFLDELGGGPVDLLGHSMGGMVSLRLVLARPELVRSLVLMDTAAEGPAGVGVPPNLADLVRRRGLRKVIEFAGQTPERELLVRCKGEDWLRSDTERRLSALDEAAFVALLPRVFAGDSLLGRLATIATPTTVIVGALDRPFLPTSERLAAGIPGAHLEVIKGAYHSPQHTHPEQWLACVRGHLARADEEAVD